MSFDRWLGPVADYARLARMAVLQQVVLLRHSKRNPRTAAVARLRADYAALLGRRRDRFGLIHLAAAEFAAATDDGPLALARLAAAAGRGRIAALLAAYAALALAGRRGARLERGDGTAADRLDGIGAACPARGLRDRLRFHAALIRRDTGTALVIAGENARRGRDAMAEFLSVAETVLARADWRQHGDAAAHAALAARPALVARANRVALLDFRFRFAHAADRLALFGLQPVDEAEFRVFTASAGYFELGDFLRRKELFLAAVPEAEAMKQLALAAFARRLARVPRISNLRVATWLARLSQTRSFWDDADFRAAQLARAERLAFVPVGGNRRYVTATVAFLRGDLAGAARRLARSGRWQLRAKAFRDAGATFHVALPDGAVTTRFDTPMRLAGPAIRAPAALVCCADAGYFRRYAAAYLASLRRHGSTMRVHFHIAATRPGIEEEARTLAESDGNVGLSFETPPLTLPAYYASMRFLRGPEFLGVVADTVILTDIDVRFRAAPEALAAAFADADLGLRMYDRVRIVRASQGEKRPIMRYPRLHPWAQINAACVVLRATPAGITAAERIARDIAQHLDHAIEAGNRAWWIDQNALFYSYRRIAAGPCRIGNVEDAALPFGSFDYGEVEALGARSPVFLRAEAEAAAGPG
ncbi:hypothetical protein [Methylobrevis albus]|uniref:Uncharacterized protein n=1 Tax=Methylobrevis albus TaxID=2793297 RepID=A0A931I2I7_9HYPH|nr:hypothetical protein [Methylobrevis albus]MBH0238244.1 hypothetical protein [Methylobrevis albus]